ncbi:hypothetical protein M9H77_11447 [Catharanthus roseus]|uniref:Uncharacterized protein n=1 Tax=Catharanthus roseus TaxID=4058 RepID=A0ACC0BEP8_CATRO|nr:hypothetical protein M9H77_11447 [Catharanthus roseus]
MECCFRPFSIAFYSPCALLKSKRSNYSTGSRGSSSSRCWCSNDASPSREESAFSYKKFLQFALDETKCQTPLNPSPLQGHFNSLLAMDGKTELQMLSFEAPKVRLLRSLYIEGSDGMQVLDFAVFPTPEFDLPIFCANFFTAAGTNIVVLDLNPLNNAINQSSYKEKYYRHLLPLGLKYTQLLPWGGKITSESLRFFSPIVVWTKFPSSQDKCNILFSAFRDYYRAWLQLMDQATKEPDASQVVYNCEAQHRYLTWRAEKDPGYRLLRRLVGETLAEEIVRNFLFKGVNELGSKTFLDYFPEYRTENGGISEKRSMIGKSFESRPWNAEGEFIGNNIC